MFLDVQTIIPLPEVADYQVQIREKKQKEREARSRSMDFTKYDVCIGDQRYEKLGKGKMIFQIVSQIILQGQGTPEQIIKAIPSSCKKEKYLFEVYDGKLNAEQFQKQYRTTHPNDRPRYFMNDDELFHVEEKMYAFSNQWGDTTVEGVESLSKAFPELNIRYEPTE